MTRYRQLRQRAGATALIVSGLSLAAQRVARSRKLDAWAARQEVFLREMEGLNQALLDRRITPLIWNSRARDLLKDLHIAAYATGRSGDWSAITPGDWGRNVSAVLRGQYAFLRRWARELYDLDGTSLAQLNARAKLYANASRQSFERGMLGELGIPAGLLPAYPGDGTTLCRANDRCRWSIRILSKSRGDFDASWRLGAAEHCATCRARARAWKKLRIRAFRMESEVEPIFAE